MPTPEREKVCTQKVRIVFDIDREAFGDIYVGMITKSVSAAGKP